MGKVIPPVCKCDPHKPLFKKNVCMALWSWTSPYYFCRFIEALRAQMKERMSQVKLELPPLCCCASSFWDSHPDTCANNCVFYNNPKGEEFTRNHLLAYWASIQLHENIFFVLQCMPRPYIQHWRVWICSKRKLMSAWRSGLRFWKILCTFSSLRSDQCSRLALRSPGHVEPPQ